MNIEEQQKVWGDDKNWDKDGDEWSDYFGTTKNLHEIILQKIEKFLVGNVLEIAPGYGRMTKMLLQKDIKLDIVDLNTNCISKCIEQFGDKVNSYQVNDGVSLNYEKDYYDFIFSYDSFVHMTSDIIEKYIYDISLVLKRGGYSFIHHSHFYGSDNPTENIAGRSNMSPKLFNKFVEDNNMSIISQTNFRTSDQVNDIITIFKK